MHRNLFQTFLILFLILVSLVILQTYVIFEQHNGYVTHDTFNKLILGNLDVIDGLEKIEDITITNKTHNITITGLDGNNASFYLLILYFNNVYHEDVCADFGFNRDNNLNYKGYNVWSYYGNDLNVSSIGRPYIGFCGAETNGSGFGIAYIYPKAGDVRHVNMQVFQPNHSIWFKGWQWDNTKDNIHTIDIFTEEYNQYIDAIGPGTHLLLYRG